MDEHEAELAAAPAVTTTERPGSDKGLGKSDTAPPKFSRHLPTQELTAAPDLAVERSPTSEVGESGAGNDAGPVAHPELAEMEAEAASIKRRHEDDLELKQERRLRQLERQWQVVGKKRGVSQPRASSQQYGDRLSQ